MIFQLKNSCSALKSLLSVSLIVGSLEFTEADLIELIGRDEREREISIFGGI
jgi:hypothetical protein